MRTVLVTCFAPFDGRDTNASAEAVDLLAGAWDELGTGAHLVTHLLPVSFARAPRELDVAVARHHPDVVVCVGEASGRSVVSVERIAVNLADASIPDHDGTRPRDAVLVPGGPAAAWASLPVRACHDAVVAAGVPVELSCTAGTYVCNATMYHLLLSTATAPGVLAGFVHVPLSRPGGPAGSPWLSAQASARAVAAVVTAALAA